MKSAHSKIKVLIADDHKMVRVALKPLLETEKDIAVVGLAENGKDAVDQATRLKPDVIIMDLVMPVMDGVTATTEIHSRLPQAKILILTTFGTSDGIAHALDHGATGAMMKNADTSELVSAIRKVFTGEKYISEDIMRQLESDPPAPELTPRQKDVLVSMSRGLTNPDIAKELGIRRDRVKEHVDAILTKIGAANRTEAVVIAIRKHLLKI